MYMNVSELLTSIKMDLGLVGLSLPVTDKDLLDVIKLKSVRVFSTYFPRIVTVNLKTRELEKLKDSYEESVYVLPDAFGGPIIGLRDLEIIDHSSMGTPYANNLDIYNNYALYGDIMLTQAEADLASLITPAFTYKYEEPNILRLFNAVSNDCTLRIELKLMHFDNLSSIKTTLFDAFYDLALLDIKRFLYNILKHYENIETAYGSINLRIDEWSNAESDRKDLLTRWGELYHLEEKQFVII